MTRFYLIRHGQTDWNLEDRWQGQLDVPLNEIGHQQAVQVASSLEGAGITAIYSSDLLRASQTAKALADATGVPVSYDLRLREIHLGEWQGLLGREVDELYSEIVQQRQSDPSHAAPPGGETVVQVRDRMVRACEEITALHPDEYVALVSHGFALAVLFVHYQGYPLEHAWDYIPQNDEVRVLDVHHSAVDRRDVDAVVEKVVPAATGDARMDSGSWTPCS